METAFDRREPAPAGFWIRTVAVIIDFVVILTAQAAFIFAAGRIWGADLLESSLLGALVTFFTFVFAGAYSVVLHAHEGQTVGKMVVKVRVERLGGQPLSKGTALLRWVGALISALLLLLGFVLAGLREDKRALHDLLAGTRVVRAT